MKKSTIIAVIVGVVVLIAGITTTAIVINNNDQPDEKVNSSESNDDSTQKESAEVKLIESGYHLSDSAYMQYAFIIENPDKSTAYEFPAVSVTAYDKNGDVIATSKQVMGKIQPGEKQAFASFMDCHGEKPDKVVFDIESGDKIIASEDAIRSSDLSISGEKERTGTYGDLIVTGKVRNTSDKNTSMVGVTVLFRNEGKIVYGSTTFVDNLNAGKEKAFEFSEYNVPKHDSFEVLALDWGF